VPVAATPREQGLYTPTTLVPMTQSLATTLLLLVAVASSACGQGRIVSAAERGAAAAIRKDIAAAMRRDLVRDAETPVSRLARPRAVFRYATRQEARSEAQRGIAAGSHFTSRALRGRPLSTSAAAERFGLPSGKTTRLTVTLPADTRVRFNKALQGKRGIGEITIVDSVGSSAVRRVLQLPRK
jgi:hypothetical protein